MNFAILQTETFSPKPLPHVVIVGGGFGERPCGAAAEGMRTLLMGGNAMRTFLLALALTALLCVAACATQKDDTFKGRTAYCYFNEKALTWRIGNDVVERVVRFDRETGALQTLRAEDKKAGRRIAPAPVAEGEFVLAAEAGGARAAPVRLDGDWVFLWQSVGTPAHGGRLLTIHLHGKGRHAGYEVEAQYEVYPGNRPYLAKWLTLINRTGAPRTVEEIVIDRWILVARPPKRPAKGAPLPEPKPAEFTASGASATVVDPASQNAMVAGIAGEKGTVTYEQGVLTLRARPGVEIRGDGGRALSPTVFVAAYEGTAAIGAALYQRYRPGGW